MCVMALSLVSPPVTDLVPGHESRPPERPSPSRALWPVPVAFAVVLAWHYPRWVATRESLGQYFNGVYRSRVLGREAILGIANAVDWLTGTRPGEAGPGFAVGWVAVTIGGLLLAWWLFRRRLDRTRVDSDRGDVVLVSLMAVSATVLTPYDYLSYALIIATVTAADRRRTWTAAALMTTAMATRESAFLVLPILAAQSLAGPGAEGGSEPTRRRMTELIRAAVADRILVSVAAAGLATYLALKLGLRRGGGVTLVQSAPWDRNFGWGSVGGLALALTLVLVGRTVFGRTGPARLLRSRRRLMWLAASPYLAVLLVASSWGEAPRLVMPLVIGEALLATTAGTVGHLRSSDVRLPPSRGWERVMAGR